MRTKRKGIFPPQHSRQSSKNTPTTGKLFFRRLENAIDKLQVHPGNPGRSTTFTATAIEIESGSYTYHHTTLQIRLQPHHEIVLLGC